MSVPTLLVQSAIYADYRLPKPNCSVANPLKAGANTIIAMILGLGPVVAVIVAVAAIGGLLIFAPVQSMRARLLVAVGATIGAIILVPVAFSFLQSLHTAC